jgi:hypothetical protein
VAAQVDGQRAQRRRGHQGRAAPRHSDETHRGAEVQHGEVAPARSRLRVLGEEAFEVLVERHHPTEDGIDAVLG